MRTLERNKVSVWYALYEGTDALTENGYKTGEKAVLYSTPQEIKANVSAARGEASTRQFGEDIQYDKVIVMEECPFDEVSVLWIDTPPVLEPDGTTNTPHDYIVRGIAQSLNHVSVAVGKVKVKR